MVAKLLEAERLRAAGVGCEVLVMDVLFSDAQCDRVVEQGLTMAVFTEEAALKLDAAGRRRGRTAQVFVKVDTGLRRVGVRHDLAPDLSSSERSCSGCRTSRERRGVEPA